jgi:hypothetical protein
MALRDLEQLYNEKVKQLYSVKDSTFNTGKPYYYNKLKPGKMDDKIIHDTRSAPITSTIRDVKRIAKFSTSTKGVLFLAKEQLLQTGNAFAYTNVINPLFVQANTIPFVHVHRNLIGSKGFGIDDSVKGRLQLTTGTEALNKVNKGFNKVQFTRGTGGGNFISRALGGITRSINLVRSGLDQESTLYGRGEWNESRPELPNYIDSKLFLLRYNFNNPYFGVVQQPDPEKTTPTISELFDKKSTATQPVENAEQQSVPVSTLKSARNIVSSSLLKKTETDAIQDYKGFVTVVKSKYPVKDSKISYMNDIEINELNSGSVPNQNRNNQDTVYSFTNQNVEDYIKVFINIPSKKKSVQFRSFIKDIKQNVRPEYKTSNYIGRTEKYINYLGVSRNLSFTLMLYAFSKEEFDGIYTKLNYLTGLAYPLGYGTLNNTSITSPQMMQPPLVTLTIGNLYKDQPGYFENLTTQFNDLYDLDKGVPYSISINATFTMIEKQTAFYDIPFYGLFS